MKNLTAIFSLALASAILVGCGSPKPGSSSSEASSEASSESSSEVSSESSSSAESSSSVAVIPFEVTSPSFNSGELLGAQYSCEGKDFFDGNDISPALNWTAGPEGTQSYAIVFKDMTIVQAGGANVANGYHWAIWNIPASVQSIPEAMSGGNGGINGASQNSPYQDNAFFGPCPNYDFCTDNVRETHEYAFFVYALSDASVSPGNSVQGIDQWLQNNAEEIAEIWVNSDAAASAQCGGSNPGTPSLDGAQLFTTNCGTCHSSNGLGSGGFPLFSPSATLIQQKIDSVPAMAGLRGVLSAEEIQAIADAL